MRFIKISSFIFMTEYIDSNQSGAIFYTIQTGKKITKLLFNLIIYLFEDGFDTNLSKSNDFV